MQVNIAQFRAYQSRGVQFSVIVNRDTGIYQAAAILPSGTALVIKGSNRLQTESALLAKVGEALASAETEEF